MAIAFGASTVADFNGTSVAGTIPTGTAAGDLLLAFFNPDIAATTVSAAPSGWAVVPGTTNPQDDPAADHCSHAYYKVAVASEPNPTWTLGSAASGSVAILRYLGVDSTTPFNTAASGGTASSTSHTTPSLTTTADGCMVVASISEDRSSTNGGPFWTPPTGWTERIDREGPGFEELGVAEFLTTNAGAVSGSWTAATADAATQHVVALRPARLHLAVIHDSPTPTASDTALRDFLRARGHAVDLVVESATTPVDENVYDAVVISESGSATAVDPYVNWPNGVLCFETAWNTLLLGSAAASSGTTSTDIDLTGTHEINTGFADPLTIFAATQNIWGVATSSLASGVDVLALQANDTTRAVAVAADAGATATTGTFAGRRAAMGLISTRPGELNTAGQDYVTAIMEWLAGGIIRRAFTTNVYATATNLFVANKPAGTVAGDVLVVMIAANGLTVSTPPSGWTLLVDDAGVTTNPRMFVYYRVVTAADNDTTSWTWTMSGSNTGSIGCACYMGVDTTTPIDAGPTTFEGNGTNMACASITLATDGAMLIGGGALNSSNTGNNITPPTGWRDALWDLAAKRQAYAERPSRPAGATGIQTWTTNITFACDAWIAALRPASSGGGTNHTQTPTNPTNPTDSRAYAQGLGRTDQTNLADSRSYTQGKVRTDTAGLTDSAVASLQFTVSRTDPLGLTDSATPVITRAVADALTLTDARAYAVGLGRTDQAGLTDSVAITRQLGRTDQTGLTDTATQQQSGGTNHTQSPTDQTNPTDAVARLVSKGQTDTLPITDAGTAIDHTLTGAQPVGLTDSFSTTSGTGHTRTPTDQVGLGDSVALHRGLGRTDQTGLTDARAYAVGLGRTDQTGLTDSATQQQSGGGTVNQTDALPLSDTIALTRSVSKSVTDPASVSDSTQLSPSLSRADQVGTTDWVALTRGETAADSTGLADAVTIGFSRAVSTFDAENLTDSATLAEGRLQTDSAGLDDSFVLELTKVIVNSAGLDDEFARLWDGSRALADAAALVDTVFVDLQLAFVPVLEPAAAISQPRGRARLAEPYATAQVRRNRNTIVVPTPEE